MFMKLLLGSMAALKNAGFEIKMQNDLCYVAIFFIKCSNIQWTHLRPRNLQGLKLDHLLYSALLFPFMIYCKLSIASFCNNGTK